MHMLYTPWGLVSNKDTCCALDVLDLMEIEGYNICQLLKK